MGRVALTSFPPRVTVTSTLVGASSLTKRIETDSNFLTKSNFPAMFLITSRYQLPVDSISTRRFLRIVVKDIPGNGSLKKCSSISSSGSTSTTSVLGSTNPLLASSDNVPCTGFFVLGSIAGALPLIFIGGTVGGTVGGEGNCGCCGA